MGSARDLINQFYDSVSKGDGPGMTACFDPGCNTVTPAGTLTPEQHEAFLVAYKAAVPDAHMEVVHLVENGDEVFVEGRFRGRHTGDLVTPQGTLPATGNDMDVRYADYSRVANGKFVEHNVFWDHADMMGQLQSHD